MNSEEIDGNSGVTILSDTPFALPSIHWFSVRPAVANVKPPLLDELKHFLIHTSSHSLKRNTPRALSQDKANPRLDYPFPPGLLAQSTPNNTR